jgi:hypothetical protein
MSLMPPGTPSGAQLAVIEASGSSCGWSISGEANAGSPQKMRPTQTIWSTIRFNWIVL